MMEKELVLISKKEYQALVNKSLNGKPVNKTGNKSKLSVDKLKISLLAVFSAATMALSVPIVHAVEDFNNQTQYMNFINSNQDIVMKNKVMTGNTNSQYYYNVLSMAEDISTSTKDKDALIYATYQNIECKKIENMNSLIKSLSSKMPDTKYATYTDFEDYLTKNGFVDQAGKIDTEKYSNYMKSYILAMNTISEYECGENIGGRIK